MQAVLWGKDHVLLDQVVVEELSDAVAVAITRGRHRKAYRYTDPNEDAAVAIIGRRATLLAVADGHNGWAATEAAVTTVVDALGDDPPAELPDQALVQLFHDASQAVRDVTQAPDSEQPESRTTLAVALVAPGRVQWASFGDSAIYSVTGSHAAPLSESQHRFVGYAMPRSAVDYYLDRGTYKLPSGAWVVVASDGFVDYAHPFPTGVFGDGDAAAVARGLVVAACEGGAGDNVAVAVARP